MPTVDFFFCRKNLTTRKNFFPENNKNGRELAPSTPVFIKFSFPKQTIQKSSVLFRFYSHRVRAPLALLAGPVHAGAQAQVAANQRLQIRRRRQLAVGFSNALYPRFYQTPQVKARLCNFTRFSTIFFWSHTPRRSVLFFTVPLTFFFFNSHGHYARQFTTDNAHKHKIKIDFSMEDYSGDFFFFR